MKTGEHLRRLRIQKGLTIGQVVEATRNKIDKTFVSRVEAGERKLSLKGAYYLSKIYDISLDELAEMAVGERFVPNEARFDISVEEKRLVLNCRKLSLAVKEAIEKIIENLVRYGITKPETSVEQKSKSSSLSIKDDVREKAGVL